MPSLRLYKQQKLCSTVAIDMLFARDASVSSALAYPVRAVWRDNPGRKSQENLQFLISVPKKKLRHAVDRVKMRRRIREAFRLIHQNHPLPDSARCDVAFIYVAADLQPYSKVARAMERILDNISKKYHEPAKVD